MAGCVAARAGQTPGAPDFPGRHIPSKRIKPASTFDIAGDAGRGYLMLSPLTETALARNFKYPKGFKCHYTFRIGAIPYSRALARSGCRVDRLDAAAEMTATLPEGPATAERRPSPLTLEVGCAVLGLDRRHTREVAHRV